MGPRGQKGLQPTRTPASLSYRAEEEGQGRDACPSTPDLCSPPTPGPSWPCLGLAKLRPHCRRLWLLGACLQPGLRAMKATPVWLLTMSLSPPPPRVATSLQDLGLGTQDDSWGQAGASWMQLPAPPCHLGGASPIPTRAGTLGAPSQSRLPTRHLCKPALPSTALEFQVEGPQSWY